MDYRIIMCRTSFENSVNLCLFVERKNASCKWKINKKENTSTDARKKRGRAKKNDEIDPKFSENDLLSTEQRRNLPPSTQIRKSMIQEGDSIIGISTTISTISSETLNSSLNVTKSPEKPTKKSAPKNRAQKKRRLRPDDERTLQILNEKFRKNENGEAVCQIEACKSQMKCTKSANLKRHIHQVHPKDFSLLFPQEVSVKKRTDLEAFNAVQDAIEMVTVNGYPFAMLNSTGMRGYIKARLDSLRSNGHALSVNRFNIVKLVEDESKLVKERIALEMNGKTVSIMFDVCTISTLSMLGVNALYMNGDEVVCHTLGIIEIKERHTSVNLADMVYDILSEFNVNLLKVFSITTDTAKNATATTDVLNFVINNYNKASTGDSTEDSIFDVGSDEEDDGSYFGIDVENEIELKKVVDKIAAQGQLVQAAAQNVGFKNTSIELINQINCGTHVFQLSIKDAFDECNASEIIETVHEQCVLLRTQIVMIEIRKLNCKVILPPLDNTTRWNSKFMMCRDFYKMKDVITLLAKNNEFGHKFEVDDIFWSKVKEIVETLTSSYNLTIDMQRVGYSLSDLYIGWIRVTKNLERMVREKPQFNLAEKLISKMTLRAPSLFKSPLLLCSVYLDPRIVFKLCDEQKAEAAMNLLTIHERLVESDRTNINNGSRINDTLDEIQGEYAQNNEIVTSTCILEEISSYEREKPYDIRAPVMDFWIKNTHKYPLLRSLANIIHAVPSNQCRTEASFSSYSYIRSKHRMSMHSENLSNVLMIRLNKDVYYTLRKERIEKILG